LRVDVERTLSAFEDLVGTILDAYGVRRSAARAFIALADGLALQRTATGNPGDPDASRDAFVALLRGYHPHGHLVWPFDPKGERGERFPRPLQPATGDPVAG
jgi:hypothetical protein